MSDFAIERVVERSDGIHIRVRRRDPDGVEQVKWVGPFADRQAVAEWLLWLADEMREGSERRLEEVGLPPTLASFRHIHEHEAELVKRPEFATIRARVQEVRARLKAVRQQRAADDTRTEDSR